MKSPESLLPDIVQVAFDIAVGGLFSRCHLFTEPVELARGAAFLEALLRFHSSRRFSISLARFARLLSKGAGTSS
jgi:hypothetical protein